MANEEHLAILRQGVDVWNEWRRLSPDIRPDFSGANLLLTNLGGAYLIYADLMYTNLSYVDLSHADLQRADLTGANLTGANLTEADFSQAMMNYTILGNVDLGAAKGLETIQHQTPSTIGIDTIYRSQGKIPETFLRGAGVPDSFITYMHSLPAEAIKYYSCFISYSSKDEELARKLYDNLQGQGVRCFYAPEDMKIGDKIRTRIDESIRVHDKLLLVLSETSVTSQWVEQEVETALAREREGRTVLFPIRLDNTIMGIDGGWPSLIRNTRNIGDFTHWKEHDAYQKAFDRLLRDLKAEAS
jgi:hypothetical protein